MFAGLVDPLNPFSIYLTPVKAFLKILLICNILLEIFGNNNLLLAFLLEIGIPGVSLGPLSIQRLTLSLTITTLQLSLEHLQGAGEGRLRPLLSAQ